jgi:peptide/nickel transport system permease protein
LSATTSAALELNGAAPAPAGARSRTAAVRWVVAVARFARRKPLGAIGGVIVLAMLVMAVFAEQIAPYRYDETVRGARMTPPSAAHWLGTDNLSRDMWSRIVYGARVSVTVGFATIALAIVVATAIGVSSAYFGGPWDLAVQRVVDAWLSFPYLVIILSVMAVLGPGPLNLVVSIAIIATATNSRVIRGATLSVMQSQFVDAARAMGCGHARIIVRHLLPNVVATIIILATIGLGAVILAESSLSFLGFGVPPPYPSWGAMLSGSGRTYMMRAPWMAIWPGVAISLAVFGFNMLGDALRDVLDPRLRGGR